jgi:predicted CXXCH cytochrome family protein
MVAVLLTIATLVSTFFIQTWSPTLPDPAKPLTPMMQAPPSHVGSATCKTCHESAFQAWSGSHHDWAMQEAKDNTVLGDFDDATFAYFGVTSRFFRRDGRFFVNTDGPDGTLQDYEIKYTFGVAPLQQYLIAFPDGRLQALGIAWDARPRAQGGQRWFHLYSDERVAHDNALHWTGRLQNWNYMCAECHSTGLEKNYDPARQRYRSSWKEINVACEACHGPGSRHVAWATRKLDGEAIDETNKGLVISFNERKGIEWVPDPQSGNARLSAPRNTEREIQLCARCHSRRSQPFADYRYGQSLMDTYLPTVLHQGLYYADGQIEDEVYEYGSFVQSRMYRAGVTCSDCHEPHSLKLRTPGNGLCLQCHAQTQYDTPKHHFHPLGSAGASCVECHMPAKLYMSIDSRRDHSFRIPRPDLSVALGTPNACSACHTDKPAQWAASTIREWYGHDSKGYQNFAQALHAARTSAMGAEALLSALLRDEAQPAIARATAAVELAGWLSPISLEALGTALGDVDPMVRVGALEALEGLALEYRWPLVYPLLRDPVLVVRIRAAGLLAGVSTNRLPPSQRANLERASDEYLAAQRLNADQPEAQVNLGNFYAARGEPEHAEQAFRTALDLDPGWVPAYVNLADLLRQSGRDTEGEGVLRAGLIHAPQEAALYHSLGLLQVRQKNLQATLVTLKQAAELAPLNARFSYVYAVALHSAGRAAEARAIVEAALTRMPGNQSLNELRLQLIGSE